MGLAHDITLGTQAAGDDHFAVFGQRFTNGLQTLFHCGINKAASIYHHQVGILIAADDAITFGA